MKIARLGPFIPTSTVLNLARHGRSEVVVGGETREICVQPIRCAPAKCEVTSFSPMRRCKKGFGVCSPQHRTEVTSRVPFAGNALFLSPRNFCHGSLPVVCRSSVARCQCKKPVAGMAMAPTR
jgi:hypothetical protein